MKEIQILIETENAAFDERTEEEVARILRKFATDLEGGRRPEKLLDLNGNVVGAVSYE